MNHNFKHEEFELVGILLVTHNGLGNSLVDCVKHVLGEIPENLKMLSVLAEDDPQHKLAEGEELIKELDDGSGVLILADIFGATPSKTLTELAEMAVEGGRECIVHMEH
jgi:PTS system mannose-specific IIA component